MLGGTPEGDLGVKGWGWTSVAKMAAAVGVSLRRRFPATALGGACLQVSSGSQRAGKQEGHRDGLGAAAEAEGVRVIASGRGRTAPSRAVLWFGW